MSEANEVTLPAALELPALNKAIDSANAGAKKVQTAYQAVGVQALMHLAACGDIGPCNRILAGMPKGSRVVAMASWMLAHGALEVNKDGATKKSAPVKFDKSKKTSPEAAMADNWFDHSPEKAIDTVFDLSKAITALIAKAKGDKIVTINIGGKAVDKAAAHKQLEALAQYAAAMKA